ncbi:LAFA_0D00144g1_1 [Lachancea sp. 'fantastica']|nr:LAFA_0D00144g1_1 [Lachancea sp. 'fantastica']
MKIGYTYPALTSICGRKPSTISRIIAFMTCYLSHITHLCQLQMRRGLRAANRSSTKASEIKEISFQLYRWHARQNFKAAWTFKVAKFSV